VQACGYSSTVAPPWVRNRISTLSVGGAGLGWGWGVLVDFGTVIPPGCAGGVAGPGRASTHRPGPFSFTSSVGCLCPRAYAMAYTSASGPPHGRTGMAEDETEEARGVSDAPKRVEEIEDPVQRAVAISEVLRDYEKRAPRLRDLRREAVLAMRAEGISYRKSAARLGVSLGAVQNIERGHGSAWGTKSRTKPAEE